MGVDMEVVRDGKKVKDFTFSSPTLKVKFTQKNLAAAKSAAKTISCSKGAVTKKISGPALKCLVGYKQN